MFRTLVANEIARRGISVREAARQIGLQSHSTVVNLLAGKQMDIETADLVCKWLGVPLSTAFDEKDPEEQAIMLIRVLFHNAPELKMLFLRVADEVSQGNISIQDFKEIVSFTTWKLEEGKYRRARNDPGLENGEVENGGSIN
jgi:transcriptional regulator with XRE-family HTH domain